MWISVDEKTLVNVTNAVNSTCDIIITGISGFSKRDMSDESKSLMTQAAVNIKKYISTLWIDGVKKENPCN